MSHSQAMQRRRSDSIASSKPHKGTLETGLRKWSGDRNRASNDESSIGKTSDKDSYSNKGDTNTTTMTATTNSSINKTSASGTVISINTSKYTNNKKNKYKNKVIKSASTNVSNSAIKAEVPNPQTHDLRGNITKENQANIYPETTSSVPRQVVLSGSPSKHVPQGNSEQDIPLVMPSNRKISAVLPPGSVNTTQVPQRKSSVNVMKRSPVTFVISKDKAGKTEVPRRLSLFQISSGVNLNDSRFLPLSREEAEDYNKMKTTEDSALPGKNWTYTMSSKVTVHGGGGAVVRKLGLALERPVLDDSLSTEERFAALSERYANLKAKIEGNDCKKKSTESSPKAVEKSATGPSSEDTLTQTKCWTTVENISVQEYIDRLSANPCDLTKAETQETLTGKKKSPKSSFKSGEKSDCSPYIEDTLIQSKYWTTVESIPVQEALDRVSDKPRDSTEVEKRDMLTCSDKDKQTKNDEEHNIRRSHMPTMSNDFNIITSCVNDGANNSSVDLNNNSKPSVAKTQVEEDRRPSDCSLVDSKTPLNSRPETLTQKTRTSVVAKLMNRKMNRRRKQSIVPCLVKRRSRVYTKDCSGHEGIPASVAEFEEIRTFEENTVLRAPVRQEASNILELLNGLSSCLSEIELVAVCKECSKTLQTLDALGSLPTYLSLETVFINPSGTIKFKHLSTGISIDDLYLAPEHSSKFASEKTCVFSLTATLWSAADWRLTEAEKPSLSSKFQELLVSMTDDAPDARPCLYDVLQTCESLQTENDMTSRERCQALLWEYQASATVDSDDTTKRKTVQGEKKHHDTLMGSISVAASFNGFHKQTTKPQERNRFVKTQNNEESFCNLDGANSGQERNKTSPKPEEMKAEKTKVFENSKATFSNSLNSEKDRLASNTLKDRSSYTGNDISNQDPTRDRKRDHSLTEDEKQQVLSLLTSTKLNKGPFYAGENDRRSKKLSNSVEDQLTKPPSPSSFAYSHYGQTESQMMFNPIKPAGRSASPSVHSDVGENQIPSVLTPTFVPIAVPVPSVAPVPMPPYWYMPQGGMMSYPHPAMSPVPIVPVDPSETSNQSVVLTDSDVSNLSDTDPRPKSKNCAIPESDKSERLKEETRRNNKESKQNIQENKGSKLPRPIWQRPVPKNRTASEESESNVKVDRRRVPFNDGFNKGSEEEKQIRTRTPSPSLGRRAAPQEVNPPRSQTPPVYWKRNGVDMSPRNKLRARASTGSLPNRPPSPSSSPNGRRRSSSITLGSITNSPVQGRKNQGSRPSSPAGSRSNSPVSILVSKFEQLSQESADSFPRVRSDSVTSMISRFGSSPLVPEDRLAKGQFKPNILATPSQPTSKTGPFRPSSVRNKVHSASDLETSVLRPVNSILSQERGRVSGTSIDESSTCHPGDPREVQCSESDPGSTDSRERRISTSQCALHEEREPTSEKCHDSRIRLLENIRKWASQENIIRDCSSSGALENNTQERLVSGLSLFGDYCTKRDQGNRKSNPKVRLQRSSSGKSKLSTYSGGSPSSNDLRNDYIIKSSNTSDNLSKPWKGKGSSSNGISRKSSLDSEPVREKGSPRLTPRDLCSSPERDPTIPFCDVRSPNDLLWSPNSDTHKFEIPVDLAILDATTPIISSSVGGLDWTYGGVDGNVISPPFPLSPGSLKDFKPSNDFTSVTFKCGEMEPERDTNCIINKPSRDTTEYVSSDCVSNRRGSTGNYARRFERNILRSTGDLETEVFASNSTSVQKSCYPTENPSSKTEINDNPRPKPKTSPFPSKPESSSTIAHVNGNLKTPRTRSRIDEVARSRHPFGDCPLGKDIATVSKNPSSPVTLRKIMSNPLSQDAGTSQRRISTSKRNSLPTSQPINLPSSRDRSSPVETRPITKSSSHTNLSQKQQKFFKSPSQNNLSVCQSSRDLSRISPKEGNLGKSSPYSKPIPSNTPCLNGEDSKSRGSSTTAKQGYPSPSKERHDAKGRSSNPPVKAGRTISSTSTSTDPSESNPVRYPYTRRGSMPAGGCSTIKPSPKAASNPTSPLHTKPPKAKIEFFGATGEDNTRSAIHPRDSNRKHENLTKTHQNPRPKSQIDCESSVDSSKAPSQCAKSSSKSGFSSRELASEQSSNSMGKTEESEVFYIPRSHETLLKSDITSSNSSKRFPTNSSSDSGLNLSDTDESRGSIGKGKKSHCARSPPLSPTTLSPSHSLSPTSAKFPIGHKFFYDPKDHKHPPSKKGPLNVSQNDPTTLAFLSNRSNSVQQENSSNPIKASTGKSKESSNKTTQSDSDNFKHPKVDMSKITDKSSPNSDEKANDVPEKLKEGCAASKLATKGKIGRSISKEFVAASTPPPDILGRPASKSPPSSSRVDSKELLGQLVKKVLNSAAAKQGSSPKTSFAESKNSVAKASDKGRTVALTNEITEAKQKEKISCQGKNLTTNSSTRKSGLFDAEKASKIKEIGLLSETSLTRNRNEITPEGTLRSQPGTFSDTPISSNNASITEDSSREEKSSPGAKGVLSTIIDMIHDEFAFDGYLDDGVEDVNMAEYVLSLAGMSEENFKEAITDQYSDLYWDEDLLHEMYEAVTEGQRTRRSTLQFSESTVSDISPPESIGLSREESYLSLEPLYFNSISRSSSERSGTGARDILMSPLGEATEFLPIKVIAPEMQADIQELLTPIFEDYYRVMGVKLVSSVEGLTEKLGTKIVEISQQLMLERRAKKKSMNSYNKMAEVENKKDVKDLASKLVNEIEECDRKIIYLKNVQRQLRNVYAERFGLDTSLLYSFVVSYNTSCVTLVPELNNNFLNFSPIWNQRGNESVEIVDESLSGPLLQSGTKLGLFSYLFARHAMSQAYVRYFLYTFRYIATAQELFNFIKEKCSTSLRTDSSGQVYNHQLQIRYRGLDLLSEWIDNFYQFDFKTNPNLIKELLAFVKDELILVDRSERGHYLMELIAEKQERDMNNNLSSDEHSDFVAVLQLEDPQGLRAVDVLRKPLGSRKAKSPVQCFRRVTPDKDTTYKATPYLKALSILDHSSRVIAEQLTLIQQDLFFHIHPVHFLNSRAYGIGVGRNQSPTKERDNMFGFSTGSPRASEMSSLGVGPVCREQNMYVSEPSTDGLLEELLEHAHDVSLWVAVEICSASSIKAQLALITKFVNTARYCCEIRNYSTCIQIVDALEMFVIRQLPAWRQVPTKTTETLEELKAVKVLLKTDSSWLMKSEASREKPTIPCFLLFVIHVQQQELGGFTLPNDMYKWTKMRSTARLVDQIRLFKQMRYAFQTDDEVKERLKQRIQECKSENLHALASENASNFHLSSQGSKKFHDAFRKMRATFGGHN